MPSSSGDISEYPFGDPSSTDPTGNLLSGDGSDSDFIDATGDIGSPAVLNQNAFSAATGGTVSVVPSVTGGSITTTVTPPAWQSALTGLIGPTANSLLGKVTSAVGAAPSAPAGARANTAGTPAKPGTAAGNTTLYIVGALAVVGLLVFFNQKK